MRRLMKEQLTYKVDDEQEATELIEEYKGQQIPDNFVLSKYKSDYKCKKFRSGEQKGEVESEWYIVVVEKTYEVD